MGLRWGGVLLLAASLPMTTLAQAVPAPASYEWRNVRVGGGGFAPGIVFSPAERGLAYLRTDMGGAYRWDAAASTWRPLQDAVSIGSYMGVESIAPDPVDPDIVYLAAGMGWNGAAAIFRSDDRGANWRVTPVPFKMGGNEDGRGVGERLAVDPHDQRRLFFGSRHDGLWRSDDSGARWRKVGSFPRPGLGTPTVRRTTHGGLSFVLFDPTTRGRVFVGSADPGGQHLFRSDDGGERWVAVRGGPSGDLLPMKAVFGSDGVLTMSWSDVIGPNGVKNGGVWRYHVASARWTDVTPPRRAGEVPGGFFGVAVSRQDPRVIAVSTVNRYKPIDTVWRSADAGAHWDELQRRSIRDVSATPFLDLDGTADFGHWIAGLAIDPFDASHAAYVTGATMYATRAFDRPGTMAWRPWTQGIEQTAIITLTSPTGGAHLVSGFGDIAGFRHDDLTVSPPHVHTNPYLTNTNTLDYAGLAPQIMVRSGSRHTRIVPGPSLAWSRDGGGSWQPLPAPAGPTRPDGSPSPEQTGDAAITVSADGSTFLAELDRPVRTGDRGKHWEAVEGLPSRSRVAADKVDSARFYALDFASNRVVRSDNGGRTFHAVANRGLPADLTPARVIWREAQNPLVTTPGRAGMLWLNVGGTLYRSSDFGEHWTATATALNARYYGLGKAAPGAEWPTLYAIGTLAGQDAVWRSIDGGASWRRINDDRHQWGLRFRVISGDPRLFGRVYIGTDGRGIIYGDPKEGK